jgi:hypothetical protein
MRYFITWWLFSKNVETRDQEPWAPLVLGKAKVMDTYHGISTGLEIIFNCEPEGRS